MAHTQVGPLAKPKSFNRSLPNLAGMIRSIILAYPKNMVKIGYKMAPPRGRDFVTFCDLFLILLLLFFFSVKRPDHISQPICTRNVSFDVDFYKEVPFGGYNPKNSYFGV